jgi:subtilisin family serine protease
MEQEYIVTLRNTDDWDQFHEEMLKKGKYTFVPNRVVVCTNERPLSNFQSHYMLNATEAEELRQDPRVGCVELHPNEQPNLTLRSTAHDYARYDNSSTISSSMKNWGLLRATNISNPFEAGSSLTTNYNYNLTGKGVDIIVIDTGIAEDHPEFAANPDGTGGSRVVNFDWTTLGVTGVTALAGGSGTKGFLGDCDGHGSNCASIVAGNTCGWAKDAKIYSIRAIPSGASNTDIITGKSLGFVDIALVFDLVKAFHLNKPTETNGYKRPTICTNSWSFTTQYSGMVDTTYRGTVHSTTSPNTNYGQVSGLNGYHCSRVTSIDISAAEAMEAGVIVLGAAGNYSHKCDVEGGIDYNNHWSDGSWSYYYHRGATPGAASAILDGVRWESICVGALDRVTPERKAYFSETGPRVDLYSPGYYIMGSASTKYVNVSDLRNSIYKLSKLSGTSQATPQVAGILACLVQARPWMNQMSARAWLTASSINNQLDQNLSGGQSYTNWYYLQDGNNKIVYLPYSSDESVTLSNVTSTASVSVL